jgi:hypothetical protein
MGLFCMEQKARDNNISNNQEDALKYLESIPVVKVEDEILFFETLKDNINDNVELPYISRKSLEKDYVSRKVSLLAEEDKDNEIKAFELMQEFDNMLMQQVANGLLEAPSKNLEKLYVNEQQFARISSYINGFKEKEGKSYKMGSRK